MKQGDKIKFSVQRLGGGGEGLAFDDGHTIVVPFALPKETVSARVVHVRRDGTAFASLLSVDKPASERTEPPCPVFGVCGGCQLMHMSYAAQLEFKRNLVSDNLKKIGGFNIELPEVVPSPCVLGYRNKVQQPVGFDGRTAFTGFFKCGTHDVVRVSRCLLQQKEARMATAVFEEFLNSRKFPFTTKKRERGLSGIFLPAMRTVSCWRRLSQTAARCLIGRSCMTRWLRLIPRSGFFSMKTAREAMLFSEQKRCG